MHTLKYGASVTVESSSDMCNVGEWVGEERMCCRIDVRERARELERQNTRTSPVARQNTEYRTHAQILALIRSGRSLLPPLSALSATDPGDEAGPALTPSPFP